jgi:hypothetical protein
MENRYKLTIGHPISGDERAYKTLAGARRAGRRLRGEGLRVTLWEGTLRDWGGWSWSSVDLDTPETPVLGLNYPKPKQRGRRRAR